jgi:hypothetical protein
MKCSGYHRLLVAREINAHGAVVDCLHCGQTYQASQEVLEDRYFHAHHDSFVAGSPVELEFFILDDLVDLKDLGAI